jgi:FMN phosphatase YigB (HAD superfamily)
VPPEAIGDASADAYSALHDEELSLFPDAHETLDRLKGMGVDLALITNSAAELQRAKVMRFALEHRFDHIQIEGEHGFGKPEERAYSHRMLKASGRRRVVSMTASVHEERFPIGRPVRAPDRISAAHALGRA